MPALPRDPEMVHRIAAALEMDEAQERAFFSAADLVDQAALPEVQPVSAAEIDPGELAEYLEVMPKQCGQLETRPYRQLSELRAAPPRLSLLGERGKRASTSRSASIYT